MSSGSSKIRIPQKKRHLIYAYYMENTGIIEVFRTLLKSYFVTDDILKLNLQDDNVLIQLLKEAAQIVFPIAFSSITRELDPELLRYNAYHRLFGYVVKGKVNFPKSTSFNSQYHQLFDGIMINIAHGILDQQIAIERLANPSNLSELLVDLRELLVNRTFNEIEYHSNYWASSIDKLLSLLDNDALMQNRLNIRSYGRDRRLIELGEKLRTPAARQTIYLFSLALRMESFLLQVERTDWDINQAAALYNSATFFKDIFGAYFMVTGTDYLQLALSVRRRTDTTAVKAVT